jgi:hypothetical protein
MYLAMARDSVIVNISGRTEHQYIKLKKPEEEEEEDLYRRRIQFPCCSTATNYIHLSMKSEDWE